MSIDPLSSYNSIFPYLDQTTDEIDEDLESLADDGISPDDLIDDEDEGEIGALSQSNQNISDGQSLISTASSAVQSQVDVLQSMLQIAQEASSGTLSSDERNSLNTQLQSLYQQYQQISSGTQYNGYDLLNGNFGLMTLQTGPDEGDTFQFGINSTSPQNIFTTQVGSGQFNSISSSAFGVSSGNFNASTTFSIGAAFSDGSLADINNDGILDVIAASPDTNSVVIGLGQGNGVFSQASSVYAGNGVSGVATGDFNDDGNTDIIVSNSKGGTALLEGNGNGTFNTAQTINSISATGITTGDFNGDGKTDIAEVDGNNLLIQEGNGDGTFQTAQTIANVGAGTNQVMSTDVNGDGIADLVTTSASGASVFLGNGNGTFQSATTYAVSGADVVRAGDFNNDGKTDLAVSTNAGSVAVLMGNGNGTFQFAVTYAVGSANGSAPSGMLNSDLEIADVNGDGNEDIVENNTGSGTISILYGKGNGTFQSQVTMANPNSNGPLFVQDLNGDGAPDILSIGQSNNLYTGIPQTVSALGDVSVGTQQAAQNLIPILNGAISNLQGNLANLSGVNEALGFASSNNSSASSALSQTLSSNQNSDLTQTISDLVKNQLQQQIQLALLGSTETFEKKLEEELLAPLNNTNWLNNNNS